MTTETDRAQPSPAPDGIEDRHAAPSAGLRRHASPLSLLIFGSVILLGLTGVLGHERQWTTEANGIGLEIHAPEIIRNGEFFEMRIAVDADAPIEELVVGVDASVWEDMTVNTMIPAASEESSENGEFRFTFARLDAGTPFLLKVDLQVNPDILLGNDGSVTVYDGAEELAALDIDIAVLP
jgi:hypothetical protein